jgi:hypothetical protein
MAVAVTILPIALCVIHELLDGSRGDDPSLFPDKVIDVSTLRVIRARSTKSDHVVFDIIR